MNLTVPYSLLISAAICGLILIPVYLVVFTFRRSTRNRKSPLNIDLLRSPGQSLREDILDRTVESIGYLLCIPLIASMIYGMDLTNRYYFPQKVSSFVTYIYVIGGLCTCVYLIVKVYRLIIFRNKLRLGYECEVAVGQDLNQIMRHGFNVYHDFPADGFNIDHIAIGPTGVYAIETKGRSKQLKAENENWKLFFDGEAIRFPTHTESSPIIQARSQAKWLSKWIESATGEQQAVTPILAFPGWYIIRKKPSDVKIYNGKESYSLVKNGPVLSDKRIMAISHQVENKCRDVKTQSYKKK